MIKQIIVRGFLVGAVIGFMVFIPSRNAHAQRVSGAVFTTDVGCNGVDLNIYSDTVEINGDIVIPAKETVYIDGGPTKIGAAGLPSGQYYVQVTEPDGTLLGTSFIDSTSAPPVYVNPMGEFADCYQLSDILVRASDSTMAGYDDTSNPGGEYKVWISLDPSFPNKASKTDNFKVNGASGGDGGEPPPDPMLQ